MARLFEYGRFAFTRRASLTLHPADIFHALLHRHLLGDWGDLDDEDKRCNEESLKEGGQLLSRYLDRDHNRFLIVTDAERATTTVLLPEDY